MSRERVRELVAGAQAAIEASRTRIDDLNVYPVPDGDTGTNLTLTVRAIAEVLADGGTRTPDLGGNAGTKDLGAAVAAAIR